jgi:hypothetical protein
LEEVGQVVVDETELEGAMGQSGVGHVEKHGRQLKVVECKDELLLGLGDRVGVDIDDEFDDALFHRNNNKMENRFSRDEYLFLARMA